MSGLPGFESLLPSGKTALRMAASTASLAAGGWAMRALRETPAALGADAGAIHAVATGSPNYRGGVFHNLEPAAMVRLDIEENRQLFFELFAGRAKGHPGGPVPLMPKPARARAEPLAVTWLGHATALLEIDGYRILTDPVWSERCSPSRTLGPQRLHPPPLSLDALPALDAVVISHDHYDHLDMHTVQALARSQRAPFITPLGVGAHLRKWGIPAGRIRELDWNDSTRIADLTLACAPARHHSGRFTSRNNTLWASWAIIGPQHRAYFGGDSGYTNSFIEIGAQHGPFDLTLLPIGAYNSAWPDIHLNPEEAVQVHHDLNGTPPGDGRRGLQGAGVLVPIHWGTFRLAPHPWAEPPERLVEAAAAAGVAVAVPKPGGRVVPTGTGNVGTGNVGTGNVDPWWRL